MLIRYKATENATFDQEVNNVLQAFQFLAYCDSIFKVTHCGNCDSPNLRFVHRTPRGYDFYSIQCIDCKHELKFGQTKEGNRLYPKGWEEPFQGGGDNSNQDSGDDEHENQDEAPAKGKGNSNAKKPKDDIAF